MFQIDTRSPVPPGEQIYRQLAFAIAAEVYVPGDRLPSVRDLAVRFVVNPNTIAKVYRDLEGDGIVEAKQGLGVFVANGSPARCEKIRRETVRTAFREAAAAAATAGLSKEDCLRIAGDEIEAGMRKRGAR